MSENLRKSISDLDFVSRIKCPKTKKVLLKYLAKSPKYFLALREISNNIIKGHLPIKGNKKNKLKKYKKNIVQLAKASKNSKNRKSLVVQSGGWLWIVPIVSGIIDLINVSLQKGGASRRERKCNK